MYSLQFGSAGRSNSVFPKIEVLEIGMETFVSKVYKLDFPKCVGSKSFSLAFEL